MRSVEREISVVIPVYNTAEKHIKECFKSIKNQTFQDFEVIIVDDGSKRSTANLLDRYTKNLENWSVIHQKNAGVSVARNSGLKIAQGRYVLFLDADDMFRSEFFQEMHNMAEKNRSDIVACWFDYYDDKTNTVIHFKNPNSSTINNIKDKTNFNWKDIPNTIFSVAAPNPWTKLFRKEFLVNNKLEFNTELFRAQDLEFCSRSLVCAKTISILDKNLILYRFNTGTSNTDKRLYPLASYQALLSIKEFLDSKKIFHKVKKSFTVQAADAIWFHLRDTDDEFIENYNEIRDFLLSLNKHILSKSKSENTRLMMSNNDVTKYYQAKVQALQHEGDMNQKQIEYLSKDNLRLKTEIGSYLKIGRSARLLIGNIFRFMKVNQ